MSSGARDPLRPPVETAITDLVNKNGVTVVVSAGNDNLDANGFTPARTPAAITVSELRIVMVDVEDPDRLYQLVISLYLEVDRTSL